MTAPNLHRTVTAENGRAVELAKRTKTPPGIVEELYLLVYNRFPPAEEKADCASLSRRRRGRVKK